MKGIYIYLGVGLVLAGYAAYAMYRVLTSRRCPDKFCNSVRLREFDNGAFECQACGNVFADEGTDEYVRGLMVDVDTDEDEQDHAA